MLGGGGWGARLRPDKVWAHGEPRRPISWPNLLNVRFANLSPHIHFDFLGLICHESLDSCIANTKTRSIGSDFLLLTHVLYATDALFMGRTYNSYSWQVQTSVCWRNTICLRLVLLGALPQGLFWGKIRRSLFSIRRIFFFWVCVFCKEHALPKLCATGCAPARAFCPVK